MINSMIYHFTDFDHPCRKIPARDSLYCLTVWLAVISCILNGVTVGVDRDEWFKLDDMEKGDRFKFFNTQWLQDDKQIDGIDTAWMPTANDGRHYNPNSALCRAMAPQSWSNKSIRLPLRLLRWAGILCHSLFKKKRPYKAPWVDDFLKAKTIIGGIIHARLEGLQLWKSYYVL